MAYAVLLCGAPSSSSTTRCSSRDPRSSDASRFQPLRALDSAEDSLFETRLGDEREDRGEDGRAEVTAVLPSRLLEKPEETRAVGGQS